MLLLIHFFQRSYYSVDFLRQYFYFILNDAIFNINYTFFVCVDGQRLIFAAYL